jgi:hypothetical protein
MPKGSVILGQEEQAREQYVHADARLGVEGIDPAPQCELRRMGARLELSRERSAVAPTRHEHLMAARVALEHGIAGGPAAGGLCESELKHSPQVALSDIVGVL